MRELLHSGELTERDKSLLVDGIPESTLALYCPSLQGRGARWLDRSQYANHGTISGATWTRLPSGLWVLSFNGTTDKVDWGADSSLGLVTGGAITLMVWIKPTTLPTYLKLLGRGVGSTDYIFSALSSGALRVYLDSDAKSTAAGVVSALVWQLAGFTWDGSGDGLIRCYVNGAKVFTAAAAITTIATGSYSLTTSGTEGGFSWYNGLMGIPREIKRLYSDTEMLRAFTRERHLVGV